MCQPIKYYYDSLSQLSRALYIFFKLAKIPVEYCPAALRKGEHMTDDFRNNVNRFKKVPAIVDNGFQLSESIAIFRYCANGFQFDDHWYPKNDQLRARIDEYLEWWHYNTRQYCAQYFAMNILMPRSPNRSPEEKDAMASAEAQLNHTLDMLKDLWLKPGCFLSGTNQYSFADVLAICEIEQTTVTGFDPTENRLKLTEWMKRVRQSTNPIYDEANFILYKLRDKTKAKL